MHRPLQKHSTCLRRDLILGAAVCGVADRVHVWQALLLSRNGEAWEPATSLAAHRAVFTKLEGEMVTARPDGGQDPLSETPGKPTTEIKSAETLFVRIVHASFRMSHGFTKIGYNAFLRDLLFIWCKSHASIDYRQGMHELAGVLLWVVEQAGGPNVLADSYALYEAVMRYAASFYELPSKGDSPVCVRANRIQHMLLVQFDPSLAEKLSHLEVEPQMYTLKWLRLLFLREFSFNEVLVLWDLLFAADRTLELMDHTACAMLLRIHDRLMLPEIDYSAALTLLMRYPHPGTAPALFVQDALALRAGESGQNLMERYKGSSTASQRQLIIKPPLAETSSNLAGVAGYSIGALLHQTDRLGLNNYFKGTLTELSRGVTEARQVLSRQSTGTSGSLSSPAGSQVNRELAGQLALVISNLRCGEPLEENLQRLEDLKYVLQGRKTLAELKQVKVPERQRPSTAPQAEAAPISSPEKATVRATQPAVPAGAAKRISLQSDFGFLL